MSSDKETLDFVTVDGLLSYGEALARRPPVEGIQFPSLPVGSMNRTQRAQEAMVAIRELVQQAQTGFIDAVGYKKARQALIHQACGGDALVFFAAWNQLLAQGELFSLFRAPIGATKKPIRRRPVAIVPRPNMTPNLAEGRIVLDIGDDRFWLMPRDLSGRTLFLTMRHGISQVESKKFRVGRRLLNVLDPERGIPMADSMRQKCKTHTDSPSVRRRCLSVFCRMESATRPRRTFFLISRSDWGDKKTYSSSPSSHRATPKHDAQFGRGPYRSRHRG